MNNTQWAQVRNTCAILEVEVVAVHVRNSGHPRLAINFEGSSSRFLLDFFVALLHSNNITAHEARDLISLLGEVVDNFDNTHPTGLCSQLIFPGVII